MSDSSDEIDNKLIRLIEAALDLADSVAKDVRRDGKVSKDSVLALNTFAKRHNEADDLLEIVESNKISYQ